MGARVGEAVTDAQLRGLDLCWKSQDARLHRWIGVDRNQMRDAGNVFCGKMNLVIVDLDLIRGCLSQQHWRKILKLSSEFLHGGPSPTRVITLNQIFVVVD